MSARIGVVIPMRDGGRFVAGAIASVRAQVCDATFEIVVVDDGSADDGAQLAEEHGARVIRLPENRGPSAARNAGVAALDTPLVALLDVDDVWRSGKTAAQLTALAADPGLGFVLGRMARRLLPGAEAPAWWRPEWEGLPLGMSPSTWLLRREAFDRVGGFDETLRAGEDLDWIQRCADAGVRSRVLPETLVDSWVHGRNLTGDVATSRTEIFGVLRRTLQRRREEGAGA